MHGPHYKFHTSQPECTGLSCYADCYPTAVQLCIVDLLVCLKLHHGCLSGPALLVITFGYCHVFDKIHTMTERNLLSAVTSVMLSDHVQQKPTLLSKRRAILVCDNDKFVFSFCL